MRQPALRFYVRERLAMGWSPEQIAGRLKREHGRIVISHESIYRFIYHKSAQKDYWHKLLPRRKSRRGRLGLRGGSPASLMQRRVSIHERPPEVGTRESAGHWEADLMQFRDYKALLVTHERRSRFLNAVPEPDRFAKPTAARLARQLRKLPQTLRQTMTFDNGTEFAMHYKLQDDLGMQTFFCDAHSPWQKGGIENAIGRLRRGLPRRTKLDLITRYHLLRYLHQYNNTPRKCLGFKTPAEVFSDLQRVALQT
jgi:IS30 family transposase